MRELFQSIAKYPRYTIISLVLILSAFGAAYIRSSDLNNSLKVLLIVFIFTAALVLIHLRVNIWFNQILPDYAQRLAKKGVPWFSLKKVIIVVLAIIGGLFLGWFIAGSILITQSALSH